MVKSILVAALLAVGAATSSVKRQLSQQTSNDLQDGKCAPTTLIYARGTTEQGNLGISVGPALVSAMKAAFGNVAVQGVNYPADFEGAISGFANPAKANGSLNMAMFTRQAFSKCSTTKVVLAGYSQGAEQVRGALDNLGPDGNKVAAAITYGDPFDEKPLGNIDSSKTKVFCAEGDGVCNGMYNITAAHLSYITTSIQPTIDFLKPLLSGSSSSGGGASPSSGASPSNGATPSGASTTSSGSGSGSSGSAASPSASAKPSQFTGAAASDAVFVKSSTALTSLGVQFAIVVVFLSAIGL